MADPLSPVSRIQPHRRAGRRVTDPHVEAMNEPVENPENLPVPVKPLKQELFSSGAYEAHLQGQDGQKRGLRGGKPVLDAARSAYLSTEWSGATDRRPQPGRQKKETI